MRTKRAGWTLLFLIIAFMLLWGLLLIYINPNKIVEYFGVKNTYFVMFFVSLLGGISSLSGVFIYTTLATFVFGGGNFFTLGILTGFGVFLSDLFFFYLASRTNIILPRKIRGGIKRIYDKLEKKRSWAIPYFMIFYIMFTPFPNDLLIIPMGLSHYPIKKAIIPIVIADFGHFMIMAYLFSKGFTFFF